MKTQTVHNFPHAPSCTQSGTTLLEVLLAIVIFVVGMLALAHLQSNLSRSSADANARTVAASIAEETIEDMRAYEVITSEPGKKAYNDIVDETRTVSRGGIDYAVNIDVQDYYFSPDRVSVQKTAPAGATVSDFKEAELTVTWNAGQEFLIDQEKQTTGGLGSGDVKVSAIIPAIQSLNSARVAAEDDGALGYPPVDYEPGLNPDIVALKLGDNKFKESTTPEPVVRRRDELVETWFDVITYTKIADESTFLRREEFASISCECTLHAASGAGADGRQPTIWTGAGYAEGEMVGKPYGESATNQQSQYCDVCCRDHHDTQSGANSYRPWDSSSFTGDHPHYHRSNKGVLSLASVGDTYIEACRLVRKDGFFRVAQDFNLQAQNAFPENYLDDTSEVDNYSDYVTGAATDYFENGTPIPAAADSLKFDGRDQTHPTDLPTASSSTSQQLRSRGIYADAESSALQANLYNCFDASGDRDLCQAPNAASPLELYPFFDVQLTKLSRWTEVQPADPVDVTNEEISNTGYSRGLGKLAGSGVGMSQAHSNIEKSNTGLISIAPITAAPAPTYSDVELFIEAGGDPTPPPGGDLVVSGSLTNANGTGFDVASVSGSGATCTRPTNTTFSCAINPDVSVHTLTVSNYFKSGVSLIACSDQLTRLSATHGDSLSTNQTVFELPAAGLLGVVIVITKTSDCP